LKVRIIQVEKTAEKKISTLVGREEGFKANLSARTRGFGRVKGIEAHSVAVENPAGAREEKKKESD